MGQYTRLPELPAAPVALCTVHQIRGEINVDINLSEQLAGMQLEA